MKTDPEILSWRVAAAVVCCVPMFVFIIHMLWLSSKP